MRSSLLIPLLALLALSPVPAAGQPTAGSGGVLIWTVENVGAVKDLSWSPDGGLIAAVVEDRVLALNSSTGEVVWSLNVEGPLGADWCPSGLLGVLTGDSVLIVGEGGREGARVGLRAGGDEGMLAWSPDCQTLAAGVSRLVRGGRRATLTMISAQGRLITTLDLEEAISSMRWSGDGELLAVGLENGRLSVFSRDGVQAWTARAGLALEYGDALLSVAWSPDSSRLVAGLASSVIVCYGSEGRESWRSPPGDAPVSSLDWSPHGIAAAYGERVVLLNESGAEVWSTPSYGRPVEEVRWSPRGDRLAILSHRWILILSHRGDLLLSTGVLPGSALAMCWSSSSGAVAVGGDFGASAFVASPAEVQPLPPVTLVGEGTTLNLSLENPVPSAVEVTLRVRLDRIPLTEREILLPPGRTWVPVEVGAPPGEHLLEVEVESPGGVSSTSTGVTLLEPLELAAWAFRSPGKPLRLTLAISNPNPMTLSARLVVRDGGVDAASRPIDLPPGPTYENLTLSLEPGVHLLEVLVFGPSGSILARGDLRVPVVGASVPMTLGVQEGPKVGSAAVEVEVENPYPLRLNATLEAWIDSQLVLRQNITLEEGESRRIILEVPAGAHSVLSRVSCSGFILAEESVTISVTPTWLVAALAVAAVFLAAAAASRLRRGLGREAEVESAE